MCKIKFGQIRQLLLMVPLLLLFGAHYASSAVTPPWSTTFNCPDWNTFNDTLNCDGLSKGGNWYASPGSKYEQITADANYPGGGGGKGQRHWIGDGTNNNSGGLYLYFDSDKTKFWIRWYARWQPGFSSNWHTLKMLYFKMYPNVSGGSTVFHAGYPGVGGHNFTTGITNNSCSSCGWGDTYYTGGVSDGSWQLFEVYFDIPNHTVKAWVNEKLVINQQNADFYNMKNVRRILIGSNCKDVSNGKPMYVDYDDIAVSTTGYIGPISGGGGGGGGGSVQDTTAPTVSVTSPTQDQTLSGNVILKASASDDVSVSGVQFQVDSANFGTEDTTAPYSINLDTITLTDGAHSVKAVAKDTAGNQATSTTVSFTVDNTGAIPKGGVTLLSESFEDSNFADRGWYDNTNLQVTSAEHVSGSTKSLEFNFNQGSTTPTSGGAMRQQFTESDQVYLSYHVKYSANWEGSNKSYHPHELHLLTNLADKYSGLANTNLTMYIEQNEGEPLFAIQDSLNIDTAKINVDLTSVTENRAVAGCNGDSDGYGAGTCYQAGSGYRNGKQWKAGSVYFQDATGSFYKNDWHHIEVFIKLNTIVDGKANADGVIQYWYDGQIVMDYPDVVLRTGMNPNMRFNQFIIAPYIGDGSPINQTFWIDELTLSTSKPGDGSTGTTLSAPSGLEVQVN